MKKLRALSIPIIAMCAFQAYDVTAQTAQIVPDRPGFSTGTFTVPVGQFYIENGYQFSFRNTPDFRASHIPALTVRTGLSNKSELFIEWNGIGFIHSENESETELPALGTKYRLVESELIELTLLGVITGSKNDDTFFVDPLIGLMWEFELTNGIEHFGGLQVESETEDSQREWFPALAAGLEFELSGHFNTFVEYYTIYSGTEKKFNHAIEIGLLYYPVPTLQVDLFGGIGFNEAIPHYIGAGISFMF